MNRSQGGRKPMEKSAEKKEAEPMDGREGG